MCLRGYGLSVWSITTRTETGNTDVPGALCEERWRVSHTLVLGYVHTHANTHTLIHTHTCTQTHTHTDPGAAAGPWLPDWRTCGDMTTDKMS